MMEEEDVHLDETITTNGPSYTSPRHVGAAGKYRYLTPQDIEEHRSYDYAVIANRSIKVDKFTSRCSKLCPCLPLCHSNEQDDGSSGRSSLCWVNSPLLQQSEDEHRRIVDRLCTEGLIVDIIDGGHSEGDMTSDYFILLIRASADVVNAYTKKLRRRLWKQQGDIRDFEIDFFQNEPPTPAERIQIVDYIVKQRAKINPQDAWIKDMFPVHDTQVTSSLMRQFFTSVGVNNRSYIDSIRINFGEKVAYYFLFIHFYNRALIPIAILGVVMEILRRSISTITYMRLLPFWGIFVSVIWAFMFLKRWDIKNATTQYEWNTKLNVRQIEYMNPDFKGKLKTDPDTGHVYFEDPYYQRLPKHFCVGVFMVFQTIVMLILVAFWVSIYELLKVKYPSNGIFSAQWFLILLEGMVFGFFVDVVQWNIVVTKMGRIFTKWENYRTEHEFEQALIRKLFFMDFLNYYTWFFSLAFVYVIPGFGDYLTNCFNQFFFGDAMNCCFGPYVDQHGTCIKCPIGDKTATCIECLGWFTFDRHHVDLSAMFVTPIIVTQLLNMAIGLIMPLYTKFQHERARARADALAQKKVMEAGSMKILGSLEYTHRESNDMEHLGNKSQARYLEYSAKEIEVLNKKAREVLFESEQDCYDPYNDYHVLTVQFGFTVMFSILWPLMPLACMGINSLKKRADAYRLCRTLKRPFPRKSNGIGYWRTILWNFAFIAVLVNICLVCVSTGSLEFYSDTCIRDIKHRLEKEGKTLSDFVMGPNFGCLHFSWRLIMILVLEHIFIAIALGIKLRIKSVPAWLQRIVNAREQKFKTVLRDNADKLPFMHDDTPENETAVRLKTSKYSLVDATDTETNADITPAAAAPTVLVMSEEKVTEPPVQLKRKDRRESLKSREQLAKQWSSSSQ